LKRDKRDSEAIKALLEPVFRSIADASMEHSGVPEPAPGSVLDDLIKSMTGRAARWPAHLDEVTAKDLAQAEFVKALRSIHINVSRECAARKAAAQLASPLEAA
jgi:hypothetical protein